MAAVGVLNVALLYGVGARLLGRGAGLVAAALLAVSPVDVETSHQVRPDVLLEGFGIAALLVFRRVGARLRDDAGAGLLIGLATAVKFTGLLMVPFYVAVRVLRPGPRVRGLAVAGALAVLVPVLATPYSLIHLERYRRGPGAQLDMYYSSSPERPSFCSAARLLRRRRAARARPGGRSAGAPGRRPSRAPIVAGLAPAPPSSDDRARGHGDGGHRLAPPDPAGHGHPLPLRRAADRGAREALAGGRGGLALLAVLPPLAGSAAYANIASRPWPADEALDWIEANVPAGARLLETREDAARGRGGALEIGVDSARHELLTLRPDKDRAAIARLIPHVDFVITDRSTREAWADRVSEEQVFRSSPASTPMASRRAGPWPRGHTHHEATASRRARGRWT